MHLLLHILYTITYAIVVAKGFKVKACGKTCHRVIRPWPLPFTRSLSSTHPFTVFGTARLSSLIHSLLYLSHSFAREGTTAYQMAVPGVGRHSIHLGRCRWRFSRSITRGGRRRGAAAAAAALLRLSARSEATMRVERGNIKARGRGWNVRWRADWRGWRKMG